MHNAVAKMEPNNQLEESKKRIEGLRLEMDKDAFQEQLKLVMPNYLTPDRMVRIALTELRTVPKLAECDPYSFLGAIMRCAQMGLEPSSEKGHVYLIPFYNGKTRRMECKPMIGYKGMLYLAAKANVYIETGVVYSEDYFEMEKGLEPKFKHRPNLDKQGEMKGVYAFARFVDKPHMTPMFEYMSKAEVDEIMNRAARYTKDGKLIETPWQTDYDAMARKTVVRRVIKYLPMSEQIEYAVSTDEQAEAGVQNNDSIISILENNHEVEVRPQSAIYLLKELDGTSRKVDENKAFEIYQQRLEAVNSKAAWDTFAKWALLNREVRRGIAPDGSAPGDVLGRLWHIKDREFGSGLHKEIEDNTDES